MVAIRKPRRNDKVMNSPGFGAFKYKEYIDLAKRLKDPNKSIEEIAQEIVKLTTPSPFDPFFPNKEEYFQHMLKNPRLRKIKQSWEETFYDRKISSPFLGFYKIPGAFRPKKEKGVTYIPVVLKDPKSKRVIYLSPEYFFYYYPRLVFASKMLFSKEIYDYIKGAYPKGTILPKYPSLREHIDFFDFLSKLSRFFKKEMGSGAFGRVRKTLDLDSKKQDKYFSLNVFGDYVNWVVFNLDMLEYAVKDNRRFKELRRDIIHSLAELISFYGLDFLNVKHSLRFYVRKNNEGVEKPTIIYETIPPYSDYDIVFNSYKEAFEIIERRAEKIRKEIENNSFSVFEHVKYIISEFDLKEKNLYLKTDPKLLDLAKDLAFKIAKKAESLKNILKNDFYELKLSDFKKLSLEERFNFFKAVDEFFDVLGVPFVEKIASLKKLADELGFEFVWNFEK